MKNLEIYLDDNTKVFECIISNHLGIVKLHHDIKMPSLKELVLSVIKGEYFIEFENKKLDTSSVDDIFERIEIFKNEENFKIIFDVITPIKILEYVYQNNIPYKKDIDIIVNFLNIQLAKVEDIEGIGEALFKDNTYIINYKEQYYEQRKVFTIAHELGHILLHFSTDKKVHFTDFDELKAANNTDYKEVLKASRYSQLANEKEFEDEADTFANNLLVPSFQLEEYITSFVNTYGCKPYMSYIRNEFGVSNGTIFYALKANNLKHKVIDDCRFW